MRKILSLAAAAALVLSAAAAATAASNTGTQRIALSAVAAKANGLAIRHTFQTGKASAEVTTAQLTMLQRKGVAVELVPTAQIVGDAGAQGKPGGGGGRVVPTTQVPLGIKMIYGNASLTKSGISGGAGVTVAVLDTGSVNHPDFTRADGSKVITGCVNFADRSSAQIEGQCADGHGHGTHVTGTIAGAGGADGLGIFGVAPNASVFSYKVLNDRGSGYADDIANAITVAADRGANIISMSLGGSSGSSLYLDAIRYANSKGVLVIAAAGNSGPNPDTIGYPGGYKEVVAVAALNPDEVVSYFSSRGITDGNDTSIVDREVEVAGPGRNTISTYKDGGYYTMSGTSMATPHIAGLAAKIWNGASSTRNSLVTKAKAHDITRAEQINNAGAGYDIAAGYGLPQVNTLSQSTWSN
jgi:subtilisin